MTLIKVNNLRDVINLAKRVLTKEKLDRQLTGQSSTPFMRANSNNSHSTQNNHKKGVTFHAMETLERNSDCIDRLTSLVSDMKMTMTKMSQKFIRVGPGIKAQIDKILHPEINPLVEEETKVVIEGITIIETIIDQITEMDQESGGTITGQVIGVAITRIAIDKVIMDQITDKMSNGLLETEVKVEIEVEITIMII